MVDDGQAVELCGCSVNGLSCEAKKEVLEEMVGILSDFVEKSFGFWIGGVRSLEFTGDVPRDTHLF
jgi:hypothetical protein